MEIMPTSAKPGDLIRARIAYRTIAAHFAQVFERNANRNVRDQVYQPNGAMPFGNVADDVLAELHHLGAVGHFEFLRKCPCQKPVNTPCDIHCVTMTCF